MARGRRRRRAEEALQLPLFGGEQAARVVEEIPRPTPASGLRQANTWFGLKLATLDYSLNTIESYTTSIELLARCLGGEYTLGDVGEAQLRRFLTWLAQRDVDPPVKTLALRVTGVRKFFQALADEGAIAANPAAGLYAPGGELPLPEVLTPEEQERVRQVAWALYRREGKPEARSLFVLMLTLDLGLRRGELEALTRSQIDMAQPAVTVRVRYKERRHRYKNRLLETPPLFREVYRDYLQRYPAGEDGRVLAASRRTLHRVVERLGHRAGTRAKVTPMVMRWTCALRWYDELPVTEVQRRLGLSPIGWQDAERVLQELQRRRGEAGDAPRPLPDG